MKSLTCKPAHKCVDIQQCVWRKPLLGCGLAGWGEDCMGERNEEVMV